MPFKVEISPLGAEEEEGRGRSVVQCSPIEAPVCAGVSLGMGERGMDSSGAEEEELRSFSGALVASSSSAMV